MSSGSGVPNGRPAAAAAASGRSPGASEEGGDWCTISNPRKAKKTKNKRQKPVPLRDFIGGPDSSGGVSRELIRAPRAPRCASPSAPEDLSDEETAVAASIRTYLADFLRRSGPARLDSPKLRSELSALEDEARRVMDRFPTLEIFLSECRELAVVDSFVCAREDEARAREMAEEFIANNAAAALSSANSASVLASTSSATTASVSSSVAVVGPRRASAPGWPEAGAAVTTAATLQQQQQQAAFHSSLGQQQHSAIRSPVSSAALPHPPLPPAAQAPIQKPPSFAPPLPTPASSSPSAAAAAALGSSPFNSILFNGGSVASSSTSSGLFGGIGSVSGDDGASATRVVQTPFRDTSQQQAVTDQLTKRMEGLMKVNSELLAQLQRKDEQLQKQAQDLSALREALREHDRLKIEVEQTREELARLRELAVKHQRGGAAALTEKAENGRDSPAGAKLTDSQLIMRLQKQLDVESLKAMTLEQQLKIERQYSARQEEKLRSAIAAAAAAAASSGAAATGPAAAAQSSLVIGAPPVVPVHRVVPPGPSTLMNGIGGIGGGRYGGGAVGAVGPLGGGGGLLGIGGLRGGSSLGTSSLGGMGHVGDSLGLQEGLQEILKNSPQLPSPGGGGGGIGAINPPGLSRQPQRPPGLSQLGPSLSLPTSNAASNGTSTSVQQQQQQHQFRSSSGQLSTLPPASASSSSVAPVAQTASRKKLLEDLRQETPSPSSSSSSSLVSESDLDRHLRTLREKHGSLSGMPHRAVLDMVRELAQEQQQQRTIKK